MKGYLKVVAGALVGCVVGATVAVQVVKGQAKQAPTPVEGKLSHISFAVADAEKTAKAFGAVFGVPVAPAKDFRDIPWGPRFPGKVMHGRLTSLMINGVSFEFLQPLDGESPWKDYIKNGGDGVHHIGFNVADVTKAREYLESKGGKQTQAFASWASYVDMHGAGLPITVEVTPLQMPANANPASSAKDRK